MITKNTFVLRVLAALVMTPLAVIITIMGGWLFTSVLALVAARGLFEWHRMTRSFKHMLLWLIFGIFYIGGSSLALIDIRNITPDELGRNLTLSILLMVWACDIGAYAAGKTIGGPKLLPKISPNKTWAGLLGGMISAAAAMALFLYATGGPAIVVHTILAATYAVVAQTGDFFISWLKRQSGVKDTGGLIPGHGGLLDRIDGLIAVALVSWALMRLAMPDMFG